MARQEGEISSSEIPLPGFRFEEQADQIDSSHSTLIRSHLGREGAHRERLGLSAAARCGLCHGLASARPVLTSAERLEPWARLHA